jgi:hypothetical protein
VFVLCAHFFVFVYRSPVQGVLPIILDLVTELKQKISWRWPRPEIGCRAWTVFSYNRWVEGGPGDSHIQKMLLLSEVKEKKRYTAKSALDLDGLILQTFATYAQWLTLRSPSLLNKKSIACECQA